MQTTAALQKQREEGRGFTAPRAPLAPACSAEEPSVPAQVGRTAPGCITTGLTGTGNHGSEQWRQAVGLLTSPSSDTQAQLQWAPNHPTIIPKIHHVRRERGFSPPGPHWGRKSGLTLQCHGSAAVLLPAPHCVWLL